MNENEFLDKWKTEIPMYDAWGNFVTSTICNYLIKKGRDLSSFLKQDPRHRTKESASLLDKAFYRSNKTYKNPYDDIEDKIGCRFVVLLIDQIDEIIDIIRNEPSWNSIECRHFNNEREKNPLLFTYESVHYVVRAKDDIEHNGIIIKAGTPCEIQIRTLLQHAYAELTHDAIYKAETLVKSDVHRTVAKSMALIETTDEFFTTVNTRLNSSTSEDLCVQHRLDRLYESYTGRRSIQAQKSSIVILDKFDDLINEEFLLKLEKFIKENDYLIKIINTSCSTNPFYNQSVVLFVYYLIKRKKHTLINKWPLNMSILNKLAIDTGVSLDI